MTRRRDAGRPSRPVGAGARATAWRRGAGLAVAAGVLGGAVIGGAVLGPAGPASAHNYLIASTPAIGATLTSAPPTWEITTNDRLLDIGGSNSGFAFRVVGPDGRYHEDGCVDVDGPSMTTRATLGASGTYRVEWQIVSADGHTVSDDYTFRWEAPASFSPRRGSTTPPACTAGSAGASAGAAGSGTGRSATGRADGSSSDGTSSTVADALWIGAGGLVVIALVVTVLLLLRRPVVGTDGDAGEHGDGGPDEDGHAGRRPSEQDDDARD